MDFSYTSYLLKARVVLPCGEAVGAAVGEAVGLGALAGLGPGPGGDVTGVAGRGAQTRSTTDSHSNGLPQVIRWEVWKTRRRMDNGRLQHPS